MPSRPPLLTEFQTFLKEQNVLGIGLAFVMGGAGNSLIKSFVDNLVMPFVNPVLVGRSWQAASFTIGPVSLAWGAFTAELLRFLILAWVMFVLVRKLLRTPKKT